MNRVAVYVVAGLVALLAAMVPAFAAQTNFKLPTETGGAYSSMVRLAPTYVDARVLAATTAESHTVPTGARFVVFSSNCAAFYALRNGTAAVPAADVTDGSGSELNPSAWFVEGASTIGLISPTACIVTLSFYL